MQGDGLKWRCAQAAKKIEDEFLQGIFEASPRMWCLILHKKYEYLLVESSIEGHSRKINVMVSIVFPQNLDTEA